MKNHVLFAIMSLVALIYSCNKDHINKNDSNIQAIDVLNNNSGFETVYDSALVKEERTGLPNYLEMGDYTIEGNDKLNFQFHVIQPTTLQIDPFYTYFRKSHNISTRKSLTLPYNIGSFPSASLDFNRPKYQYLPYSNIQSSTQLSGGNGFLRVLLVKNDVNLEFSSSAFLGVFDLGYRHFMYNSFSFSGLGNAHGAFTKLNSGSPLSIGATYTMFYAPVVVPNATSVLDVHLGNNNAENYYALAMNTDSVFVVKYNYSTFGTEIVDPTYTTIKINKIKQKSPITVPNTLTFRHYSVDGNKIAFGVYNSVESTVNTYTYDYTSNILSQNLSNVQIELNGGSILLLDMDEQGNVYFLGQNGGAVYMVSQSNSPQLVGNDNFLKIGKVSKLKYLNGKVYLAIIADQSEKGVHQLSIVRQK